MKKRKWHERNGIEREKERNGMKAMSLQVVLLL